jgi:hypothetical protein
VELGHLRPFSDVYGRHAVRLDGTEAPLRDIARRLEKAGCEVKPQAEDWADPSQFPLGEREAPSTTGTDASDSPTTLAREVGYLNEDARRWIEDRDRELSGELRQRSGEMNASGLMYSGAHLAGLALLRQQALLEYRDEMSAKRRRYAELLEKAGPDTELPRFELTDASREIVAGWRAPIKVSGMDQEGKVADPTDESREPDLRRFEQEGDGTN